MMQRIELIVSGKVQGVFFRANTLNASKKFKVKGFVENLESGEVRIIAEGEKKELEKFIKTINEFDFTEIKELKIEWKKALNEFNEFRIKY